MRWPLVWALVALSASSASAQAPRLPVEIEVHGVFGDDTLVEGQRAPLAVRLQNLTQQTFRGRVRVTVPVWDRAPETHEIRVDLPPGAVRNAQFVVDLSRSSGAVQAVFLDADGDRAGIGSVGLSYRGSSGTLVVLSDPPRLRNGLQGMQVAEVDQYGSSRMVELGVGVVSFDPQSGDPIAPVTLDGWSGVRLLVASAPALERLLPAQFAAVSDWVHVGGRALVFPRTPEDFAQPHLRALLGDVRLEATEELAVANAMVPEESAGMRLVPASEEAWQVEAFGGSRGLGFGRVYAATYDGTSPPLVDGPEPVTAARAVTDKADMRPKLVYGAIEHVEQWGGGANFQALRSALDPNESFRPALAFVAFVLLLYVVFLGPLNFRFVEKRARPTLVLVTTPILAAGCLALLLAVGYIGKGTQMRYRSASLVELIDGEPIGPERQYLGLFLTRPSTFDLRSSTFSRPVGTQGSRVTIDHDEDEDVLRGMQGGLWETLFVRREQAAHFAAGVSFEYRDAQVVAVQNGTGETLRGAFVMDGGGSVYPVGDVAPGARGVVAATPTLAMGVASPQAYAANDAKMIGLTRALGLEAEESDVIYGMMMVAGGSFQSPRPTLYARLEAPSEEIAERFAMEEGLRLLRVVARESPYAVFAPDEPPTDSLETGIGALLDGVEPTSEEATEEAPADDEAVAEVPLEEAP